MKQQSSVEKNDERHLVFVVHKHHATSLHYDFRLQVGDLMPSWAIPKGPTLDPSQKRLAMETTDHSLEYRHFEGVIEEGKYGAGPVMIWDEGYYYPEVEVTKETQETPLRQGFEGQAKGTKVVRKTVTDIDEANRVMHEGLEKGEIKFRLFGKKLNGSFALVKTKGFGGPKAWLMIKHNDEFVEKNYDAHKDDNSARSGLTMKQIEAAK